MLCIRRDLSNNRITSFPKTAGLTSLRYLYVTQKNQLKVLIIMYNVILLSDIYKETKFNQLNMIVLSSVSICYYCKFNSIMMRQHEFKKSFIQNKHMY